MKYAVQTSVSVEKSRAEIETILTRYGANKFAYFTEELKACIAFEISGKRIRSSRRCHHQYDEFRSSQVSQKASRRPTPETMGAGLPTTLAALALQSLLEWVETDCHRRRSSALHRTANGRILPK
jgi:hypothetical protein